MNIRNAWELDVLEHTSNTGRYVTDETKVIALAERGLLRDHGAQQLAGGMHYFTLSARGRDALNEHHRNLCRFPQPKRKRPASEQFQAWRDYREATWSRITFREFLKEVWPNRRAWA
jgi:hypothetical protein